MSKIKKLVLFLCVSMSVPMAVWIVFLYDSGTTDLNNRTELLLQEASEEELNRQYAALELYEAKVSFGPNRNFKHYSITSAGGLSVGDIPAEQEKWRITSDLDKQTAHWILSQEGIDADSLLHAYCNKLKANGLTARCALRIHVRKEDAVLTSGDSALFRSGIPIRPLYAGLGDCIEIESVVQYSWLAVFKQALSLRTAVTVLAFSLLLFVVFHFHKKRRAEVPIAGTHAPAELRLSNLCYVCDTHTFYVDGRGIRVRTQSAALLELFLRAPSHCVSKEGIIAALWRVTDDGVEDRLRRVMSDLRKLFREESVRITIKSVNGSYRLLVQDGPFVADNQT